MNRLVLLSLAAVAIGISVVSAKRFPTRNGGKKMVCYVGTWAVYRPGDGKFEMEDIDPQLCTHIMYGFTKLENCEITVFDPWGDLGPNNGGGKDMYKRFTSLKQKNRDLKTIIAIGGWNEGSTKYSDMAKDSSCRRKFVRSIVPFLEKYNFDGLDLDWEYPTQRGGKPEDKDNFSQLVTELREELDGKSRGYLLTAAVSPNTKTVEIAYDVPLISQHLDFINVMCYDYHGYWEGHEFTGHNTPLYRHPLDDQFEPLFNANDTVMYWINAGLPKEKLVMGMALYGRGFTLASADDHDLYSPISGGIPMGPYTRQDGTWGYNEICEKYMTEMDQWRISIDPYVKAPYAYKDRHWIGYEDVESVYYKAEYARNMGLAGAMVWSLETDDFRGKCHGEKYILLKTIVSAINGGGMPTIPQRPQEVPAPDSEYPEEVPATPKPTTVPRPTRPAKRTTPASYPDPDEEDDYTTTRRPSSGGSGGGSQGQRPTSRTTRRPYHTTNRYPDEEEDDDYTTTRRPSSGGGSGGQTSRPRPSRPRTTQTPRRTTTEYPGSSEEDYTTTRRTKPGSGGNGGNNNNNNNQQGSNGECREEGIYPSGNCSGFYHCVRRGNRFDKIEQMCPAGTAFNPDINGCDHKDNVPGCSSKVKASDSFRAMGHN